MRTSRWIIASTIALLALIGLIIAHNIGAVRQEQQQAWEENQHARAIELVTLAVDGCAGAHPIVRQPALDTLERLHASGESWFESAKQVSNTICDTALAHAGIKH